MTMADKDYDQYAVPQGSLFFELQRIANHAFAADGSFKGPREISINANGRFASF